MTGPSKAQRAIDLINRVDNAPSDFDYGGLYKLFLPEDPRAHGYLTPDTVAKLTWAPDFKIDHTSRTIQLTPGRGTISAATINAALQSVVDGALALGPTVFPHLTSHSEMFRIIGAKAYPGGPVIQLERFAAPLFGICSRGAHMTAYVKDANGLLRVWVARRAKDLHTYPGMLDTTVAGGVKATDTPRDCIVAEADEEAALPRAYVEERIVAAGAVTYVTRKVDGGVSPTVLYVYDLRMDDGDGVEPRPKDGEVEGFYLIGVDEAMERMMDGEFKPNCCLVMLDFFVRHGVITEESENDYLEIVTRLRRGLPVPVTAHEA